MQNLFRRLIIFIIFGCSVLSNSYIVNSMETSISPLQVTNTYYEKTETVYAKIEEIEVEPISKYDKAEIELVALITMAEAEGECEQGKRLVIDTILNRVDSEHFPDTVSDVIYQPNQFTSVWNGRVKRCEVQNDICKLVTEEMTNRTNSEVLFFTANEYGKYGTPMFNVGNHYFSSC